ncbi:dynactin subunit 2-like isoform X11 [Cygnus olor]|uniref:dynactin subunit 2-like isoform X11 n=1 Tax=Cygnus olor TaxID=8869 RepID=UPI001ADE8471|nr:dynactin subunit 2-like isoform X11 [Cygnus olor]
MRLYIHVTRPRFILKLVQEVVSMSSCRLRLRSVSWWWSSGVVGMKAEALLECRVNSVMLQQQLLNSAMLHLAVTGTSFVVRLCPSLWSPVWTLSREEWIMELEKRLAQLEATVQCKPISQSILGKVNEIAEHEAMVQCANSQSKIHQTYELVQHWDPIASSLPDVVQYLLTLRDLHEEATQVGQVLEDMETMQKEIADALQVNTFLLEVVQKTMKEFLAFVEGNVAETEASIRKLQK